MATEQQREQQRRCTTSDGATSIQPWYRS